MSKTITVAFYDPDTKIVTGVMTGDEGMAKNSPNQVRAPDGFSPEFLDSWQVSDGVLVSATRIVSSQEVNEERDRRIVGNFTFDGRGYDFDPESVANITGAGASAGISKVLGSVGGDYRWADSSADFHWRAKDNSSVLMDAPTCFAFSQAAMWHKAAHVFAAGALKDMATIPMDFADDHYWP